MVLKNVNYNMVTSEHVSDYNAKLEALVDFCTIERSRDEMMTFQLISSRSYFQQNILKPLLESGKIKMTIPDKPKSKNQKYIKA